MMLSEYLIKHKQRVCKHTAWMILNSEYGRMCYDCGKFELIPKVTKKYEHKQ